MAFFSKLDGLAQRCQHDCVYHDDVLERGECNAFGFCLVCVAWHIPVASDISLAALQVSDVGTYCVPYLHVPMPPCDHTTITLIIMLFSRRARHPVYATAARRARPRGIDVFSHIAESYACARPLYPHEA